MHDPPEKTAALTRLLAGLVGRWGREKGLGGEGARTNLRARRHLPHATRRPWGVAARRGIEAVNPTGALHVGPPPAVVGAEELVLVQVHGLRISDSVAAKAADEAHLIRGATALGEGLPKIAHGDQGCGV